MPLRLEIGPKDLEKNQCVLVRRDTREKVFSQPGRLETAIPAQLRLCARPIIQRALKNREARTWAATTMEEVKQLAPGNTGYIKTNMWCGDLACEMKMKEEAGLVQPLHAPLHSGAPSDVPLLRQARQDHGLLGA